MLVWGRRIQSAFWARKFGNFENWHTLGLSEKKNSGKKCWWWEVWLLTADQLTWIWETRRVSWSCHQTIVVFSSWTMWINKNTWLIVISRGRELSVSSRASTLEDVNCFITNIFHPKLHAKLVANSSTFYEHIKQILTSCNWWWG